ncbi:MAG TPA: Stk1 family PASTA domain-containing Ser/Thr kinase [Baekduia sp.]|uniref:Stk1 family PASTA domain-containing Ser/Thr kinase n=1 Tax=Baekduia sp. TaxID=2600305 RepID=UPI002D793B07|nr:Stk1 family PASTA domain-containing Ser/Thr kinase [Baekduia sp.]HET6508831.1 Stk1 family PASTA domain-containing Ser/Thr kinase [Baekduia sp.]
MTDVPETSTIIDGRYRVLHRVGSGGMADVVCAEDLQLGRKVAIKLLHRRFAQDEEFVERFRREASSAAGLQHPHVVAVYDRGAWDDTYYIAMEYLEGRTLKKLVQDEAPLAPARAIDFTIQILRAARFAHKRGIIHRDLKPHNVIVDGEGRAKVTDFGIAKAGASDMTQTGSIMGTAQYLSPEQAQGHAVSAPSDLYSIGIILYEMLTGRVPFDGESAVTIALKQVGEAPVPPSHLNPAVPPALEAVVLKALEKDPARRFADADEFIAALEEAARGIVPASAFGATGEATRVLQATGPMMPLPPPDAAYAAERVDQRYYGPPPAPGEDVEHPEDGDGPGKWWIALLVGLVVAGAIVAGLLLTGKDKVGVVNVVGKPQAESELVLKRAGLQTSVTMKDSDTAPEGTVTGQDPAGGSRVPKGSTVTLTVSSGPGTARVPDLTGQARSAARKQLTDLGFKIAEEEEASETVTENHVIGTRPDVGTLLDKGTQVTLVLSSGKQRVTVPDVGGLSEDEARSTLEALGFAVAKDERETDDDQQVGRVLEQSPAAKTSLAKGGTVTLTIGKAPAEIDVPNVVGQGRLAASAALKKAGFKVQTVAQPTSDRSQDLHVISQSPASGKAKKGDTVTITYGQYQASGGGGGGGGGSTTAPGSTATPGNTETTG